MALSYKVWSQQEDETRNIIEKGEYQFIVKDIKRTLTKKGNYEMLVVDLELLDNLGRVRKLKDWIVLMDEMGWKLRHFAASCGLLEQYESQTLDTQHFLNREGVVKISVGDQKDEHGQLTGLKQNSVADYIKPENVKVAQQKTNDDSFIEDDIPL